MIRKNKWRLFVSSVIILLPALFGLICWRGVGQTTIHWGTDGSPNSWSGRFLVFAMAVFMLAVHWVCIFFTVKDPKNKNQSNKVFGLVLWVCPAVSLFVSGVSYAASFGKEVPVDLISLLIIGLMFVIIGNYLPKCRQNHTIGVRVKWTLENEENWNATHRISGRIWVIGGLLMMACVFLPRAAVPWVFLLFLVTLAVIPVVYYYMF